MYRQILFSGLLIIALSGCSTLGAVRAPSQVSELQIKVAQMQRQLDARDQEVTSLKDEVTSLGTRIQDLESSGMKTASSSYDEFAESETETPSSSSHLAETDMPAKNTDIIRVDASASDVQKALKKAGYYNGNIDGKFGKQSQSAVVAFQKDHHLETDGIVGRKTWSALRSYLN